MTSTETIALAPSESPWKRFTRRFGRQGTAIAMLITVGVLVTIAFVGPLLAPYEMNQQDLQNSLAQPSAEHLLGTDELGRDALSRILVATRVTLIAGAIATAVAVAVGLPLGLLAGFMRGRVDAFLNMINDAVMAIPGLILAIAVVAVMGPGIMVAMTAVGLVTAPRFFRVARAMAMTLREEAYVEASRSVGAPGSWIVARHVLPNSLSPLIVQISLTMGFSILIEAGLSFLGLGVQPPEASWGSMLQRSAQFAATNPLLALVPGLLILITVLAFNTLGDAIRDSLGREERRPS